MKYLVVILALSLVGCGSLTRWRSPENAPAQIVCSQSNVAGLLSIFNGGSNITSITIYKPEQLTGVKITGATGCGDGFVFDGTGAHKVEE